VIHRKTSRLADDIDNYQKFNNNRPVMRVSNSNVESTSSFQNQMSFMSKEDVQILRKERNHLLDRMSDMEAEFLANRMKESTLQEQINKLEFTKADLEEKLKSALHQKHELHGSNNLILR